jgi:hypothetical protein
VLSVKDGVARPHRAPRRTPGRVGELRSLKRLADLKQAGRKGDGSPCRFYASVASRIELGRAERGLPAARPPRYFLNASLVFLNASLNSSAASLSFSLACLSFPED